LQIHGTPEPKKDLCLEHSCQQALVVKDKIKVLQLLAEEHMSTSYSSLMKRVKEEEPEENESEYLGE